MKKSVKKNCSSKVIDKRNSATVENVNFNNRKFTTEVNCVGYKKHGKNSVIISLRLIFSITTVAWCSVCA